MKRGVIALMVIGLALILGAWTWDFGGDTVVQEQTYSSESSGSASSETEIVEEDPPYTGTSGDLKVYDSNGVFLGYGAISGGGNLILVWVDEAECWVGLNTNSEDGVIINKAGGGMYASSKYYFATPDCTGPRYHRTTHKGFLPRCAKNGIGGVPTFYRLNFTEEPIHDSEILSVQAFDECFDKDDYQVPNDDYWYLPIEEVDFPYDPLAVRGPIIVLPLTYPYSP